MVDFEIRFLKNNDNKMSQEFIRFIADYCHPRGQNTSIDKLIPQIPKNEWLSSLVVNGQVWLSKRDPRPLMLFQG
jgi:hypothetical protein